VAVVLLSIREILGSVVTCRAAVLTITHQGLSDERDMFKEYWLGNLNGRDHLVDIVVDGRMILKLH
jgi:hypothetical protein